MNSKSLSSEFKEFICDAGGYQLDADSVNAQVHDARCQGFTIWQGDPTRLLLDLDDGHSLEQYQLTLPLLNQILASCGHQQYRQVATWISKSGTGTHVVLQNDGEIIPIHTRLLLQTVLGSDWKREVLGSVRVERGLEEPSYLFRPPLPRRVQSENYAD